MSDKPGVVQTKGYTLAEILVLAQRAKSSPASLTLAEIRALGLYLATGSPT